MKNIVVILLFSVSCLVGCASSEDADMAILESWMTGTFSSGRQAAADSENYFDIRLVMIPVWTDRADGPWLYVEQAAASALGRPYRQRVYHLVNDGDGDYRSEVYTLPGKPLDVAGCWRAEIPLHGITPEDLALREGCAIHLRRTPEGFVGSTRGKGCSSKLGDAAYATSEVTIVENLVTSWDRGFDADDVQVWGATEGAYEFVRISPTAPPMNDG